MQKVSYMGDGTTTEFTFNFPYFENSNIIVTKNNQETTGYTIIGTSAAPDADIPYTGGRVVFDIAPRAIDSITIARQLPLIRNVDYQPTAKIEPTILNQDLNYLMEVIKDRKDELDDLIEKYAEIANKESTKNLLTKIENVTEKIDDFDEDIENKHIMSRDDFYSYTTNCVTNIPQDIKLELNNGTLTLKAGSKAYRPNGAGVFTPLTANSDMSVTSSSNGTYVLCSWGLSSIYLVPITNCFSGTTQPSGFSGTGIWYDTVNNVIKATYDGGSTWDGRLVFPMAIITVSSGAISSIDQIFNGFGYIGSCVFTLPGVQGLYPNGRNTDGTLKNGNINCTDVQVSSQFNDTLNHVLMINPNGKCAWYGATDFSYDPDTNIMYDSLGGVLSSAVLGTFTTTSGVISNFKPNKVFRTVDYNNFLNS